MNFLATMDPNRDRRNKTKLKQRVFRKNSPAVIAAIICVVTVVVAVASVVYTVTQ